MTIRSLGYDGSIGEREWAMIAPAIGSPPTTVGAADFQVTATSGLQVRVAPGAAAGWGIYDVSDAAETITIEAATSAVRYDAVVLRRDWSGTSTTPTGGSTGGRSFIAVVKGGSSPVIPSLNTNGGVLADQALALVQVSPGASTVLVSADLRASFAPAAVVRSPLAMTGPLGARYVLAPTGKRYVVGLTAAGTAQAMEEWEPDAPTLPNVPRVRSGVVTGTVFNTTGTASIVHNLGYVPAHFSVNYRNTAASILVTLNVAYQTGAVAANQALLVAKRSAGGTATDSWAPYTGTLSQIDWLAVG
mgnify:FL=1